MTNVLLNQFYEKSFRRCAGIRSATLFAVLLWGICGVFSSEGTASAQGLRIDEVMMSNGSTLSDEFGKYPDWVEIANLSGREVDLRGHGLSTDPDRPFLFQFPSYKLAPGERLVVFCSGREDGQWGPVKPQQRLTAPAIEGVVLHLDASLQDAFLLHENGAIAQWVDQTPEVHYVGQPDAEKAPTLTQMAPRGVPAVFFDGEDDFFELDAIHNAKTVFWVGAEHPFATDDFRPILGHSTQIPMIRGANHQLVHHLYSTQWLDSGVLLNGELIDGAIVPAPVSSALLTFRTRAPRIINTLGTDRFIDNQYWHGWFSELICFDRVLTAEEETEMQGYLMGKWGLPTRYFHAPFTLPNESGVLVLSSSEAARLDAVTLKPTLRDVSLQRVDERNEFRFVNQPSPGDAPKSDGYNGMLDTVSSSLAAGAYDQPVSVELRHADSAAEIRYTLNGDEPGKNSMLYQGAVNIVETTVLKAKAFREDYLSGETLTASYIIEFPTTIPMVSISGPPDDWFSADKGIYALCEHAHAERPHYRANFWQAWEREVEFEWFEPDGQRTHQQTAGAKIHGGWSRASDQKSVALIARSRYGDNRFDGRFFDPDEEISVKQLLLRNAGNDWSLAMLRDPVGQSLMGDIGLDTQPYRPVHVFLNGEYYGIHNLRQRANEHFLSAKTGIPDDQIDLVASNFDALSGDHAGALAFIRWIALQDASDPAFEEELERRMDVDNFLDYIIGETCIDNFDWPNNNVRFWKERQPEARWRWMPFDLDGAFNPLDWKVKVNTIRRIINFKVHSAAKVFVAVTENESLLKRFLLRFQHRLNNTFSTHNMLSRIETMASALRPEMPRHIERWMGSMVGEMSFPNSIEEWEERLDVMRRFARERPSAILGFVVSEFDLEDPVSIRLNLPPVDSGKILIDGLPLVRPQEDPWEGHFFQEFDITVSAQAKPGFAFRGWAELNTTSTEITVHPADVRSLTPIFEQVGEPAPVGTEGRIHISEIMYHPSTQRPNEEFIELVNVDDHPVQLYGWSLDRGVSFEFPNLTLDPGEYMVVSADPAAYRLAYPDAPAPLGPWDGKLGNSGEEIRLRNHLNKTVDSVDFRDEGDWSDRVRGVTMQGHQGWTWSNAHDGEGKSLERISLEAESSQGQNWAASTEPGGTPGSVNSVNATDLAPFVNRVHHSPAVPNSEDLVWVSAEVEHNGNPSPSAELWFRIDGESEFRMTSMLDNGAGKDKKAEDGIFGAELPPFPNGTVVEFYVLARSASGLTREWPKATAEGHVANALFQVDDSIYPSNDPVARVITTEAERLELEAIGRLPWNASSDAQMNATFVMIENGVEEIRYQSGFRIRGTTSRNLNPKNRRVNFNSDQPWRGRSSVIFNAVNVPSHILGSELFRFGGVPVSQARPVMFLENNLNHASSDFPQFGMYAQMEALNDNFVDYHFDGNKNGNLYRPYGYGNLEFLGTDPLAYKEPGFYVKATQVEENDWSDLIRLTQTLAETPDASYESATESVAHVEEWLRYFAVDTLTGNMETSFANGGAGDYAFYIGEKDSRAVLIPYDLDSLFGMAVGGVDMPIFRAIAKEVPARFLQSPGFARRYYQLLQSLADDLFDPEKFSVLLGNTLGDWTTPAFVERIRQYAMARRDSVLAQIPRSLQVVVDLPLADPDYLRYYQSPTPNLTLQGVANALETDRVLVQGLDARWSAWEGKWSIQDVALHSGVNEIVIQSLDASGNEMESLRLRVFFEGENAPQFSGELQGDTVWSPAASPIQVETDLIVPEGVTLTVLPGTSVEFLAGSKLTVRGTLKVLGTPDNRVYFSAQRFAAQRWGGIHFDHTMQHNELNNVTIEWTISPGINVDHSRLDITGGRWIGAYNSFIISWYSTLAVRDCIFPDVTVGEPIAGIGIPEGGYWIIEGCEFGKTTGYSDIIDFTGGKLPGPVAQFLNNRFNGGPDDALDLDGGDGYVEGNLFMNFHQANASTSESHAISTGVYDGVASNLTIVRNVFIDNDHDILLKEWSSAHVAHNTFIDSKKGAISLREQVRQTQPPLSLYMEGNVFRCEKVLHALEDVWGVFPDFKVSIHHSILPEPWNAFGEGNRVLEPVFVDEEALDFRLAEYSGLQGLGTLGLDPGAYVPSGVTARGIPWTPLPMRSVELEAGGPGVVAYRYRLNQGEWSAETTVDIPVVLTDLADGVHQLEWVGKNVAGVWQTEEDAHVSPAFEVSGNASPIRLNEILAQPISWSDDPARKWEFVELVHLGQRVHLLKDYTLTDDPAQPEKFRFTDIALMEPGTHMVVGENGSHSAQKWALPFGLNRKGESVYLFRQVGGEFQWVDQVTFGLQPEGWSMGRDAEGRWMPGIPTPGAVNYPAPRMGTSADVVFSEWAPLETGDFNNGFIELHNTGEWPVDLTGWRLGTEPSSFAESLLMPNNSFLGPDGYLVLETGGGLWDLPGNLHAEQDVWSLRDRKGDVVDRFWYANPRSGYSFRRDPSVPVKLVQGTASPERQDEVGSGEGALVINEIAADNRTLLSPWTTFADWVEIWNASAETVSLGGIALTDDVDDPFKWTFPAGTQLSAFEVTIVWLDGDRAAGPANTGFGLKSGGEQLWLFDSGQRGGGLLDTVGFGPQIPSFTIGRDPATFEWGLTEPTPGWGNNTAVLGDSQAVKINEWMADPDAGPDWLELFNPSEQPVSLAGMRLSDDPADSSKHSFSPLSYLGVGVAAYLQIQADGKGGQDLEADFKISAGGESLALFNRDGGLVDLVDFGQQETGVSQGRWPDGSDVMFDFFQSTSQERMNVLDGDLDGLPDLWEVSNGFNPDLVGESVLDTDNDGVPNYLEYLANTDPKDASSRFAIEQIGLDDTRWTITFQGKTGRGYEVQASSDLSSGVWETIWKVDPLTDDRELTLELPLEAVRGFIRLQAFQ